MKDCLYCENVEKLNSLMIPICELGCTRLFLFRDQNYYGRCVIAYKEHGKELYDLTKEEAAEFIADMQKVGLAIQKAVDADKINYGMFSDTLAHLHVHIVPKKKGGYGFGGTIVMNPEPAKFLSDEEYQEIIEKIKSNL
ncbi:MAG TPA: HIT family protein [Lachnospiraceae bacterium]|nr:HIT family protein [Lachnospiraceae bacterium]